MRSYYSKTACLIFPAGVAYYEKTHEAFAPKQKGLNDFFLISSTRREN